MKKNYLIGLTIILVLLLNNSASSQSITVTGKLLDFNGNPSENSLIGISSAENENASEFVNTDTVGKYEIKISRKGVSFLVYSMPGHKALRIPLLNNVEKTLNINVTLEPYKYLYNLDDVSVIGSFNNFNFAKAEKMNKRDDGTYFLEVNSNQPEIKYQLYKIVSSGRSINGTGKTAFEPDSSGDYKSVIPVVNGKAVIEFDPSLLPKVITETSIEFINSPADEKFFNQYKEFNKIAEDAALQIRLFTAKNKTLDGYQYDAHEYLDKLLSEIDGAESSEYGDLLKLFYIRFAMYRAQNFDYSKAAGYYESLSPDNPAWNFMPSAFYSYNSLFPQYKWKDIQDNFLTGSKSETIKLGILSGKLSMAKYQNNEDELKKLHETIKTEFPNSTQAKSILMMFPIETKIKIGAEIPDFELKSIDDANIVFSKKNLLGKIYMIDFWATWCGPCVGEMESLHKVFEKFGERGFMILSISMDGSIDDVMKFRNNKWKMPWNNAFLGRVDNSGTAKKFEVIGIPRPILVGTDGKILALEADLRGNKLETTLEQYFK